MSVPLVSLQIVGGADVGSKKFLRVTIAVATAIALAACSSQDPIAAKPFGNAGSLYEAPSNMEEFIAIAQAATLHVFCDNESEDDFATGSGFSIEIGDSRYIITNAHVIKPCMGEGSDLYVYDADDDDFSVEILAYRHVRDWRGEWDVAVLSGIPTGRALTLSREDLMPGHWVLGAGWPSMNSEWYQHTAIGQVLGLSPDGVVVHSGVSAPGMSGGPLLNSKGELVAIHFASSWDDTRRALAQPLANLCQVAFVCGGERKPTFPLEFPKNPIQNYIEDED